MPACRWVGVGWCVEKGRDGWLEGCMHACLLVVSLSHIGNSNA